MLRKRRTNSRLQSQLIFQPLEPRRLLAALANGQEVESAVDVGAVESFDIQVQQGDTLGVSVGEVTSSGFWTPRLTIFGPNGVEIATASSASSAQLEFMATQSGTYTAVVEEDGRNQAFDFRIRALTLPGSPQIIDGRDRALENGEEVIADLPIGVFNVYPIQVSAGAAVDISVGRTGGDGGSGVTLTVFGPGGTELGTGGGIETNLEFVATQTGTYTAVVEELDRNQPVSYRIRALTIPGTPQLLSDRDKVLQNGEEVTANVPLGGFNVFRLQANTGDVVGVSVGEVTSSGFWTPRLTIFGPNGVEIATASSSAQLEFMATQSGTYTAVVEEDGRNQAFDFRIRALTLPGSRTNHRRS